METRKKTQEETLSIFSLSFSVCLCVYNFFSQLEEGFPNKEPSTRTLAMKRGAKMPATIRTKPRKYPTSQEKAQMQAEGVR